MDSSSCLFISSRHKPPLYKFALPFQYIPSLRPRLTSDWLNSFCTLHCFSAQNQKLYKSSVELKAGQYCCIEIYNVLKVAVVNMSLCFTAIYYQCCRQLLIWFICYYMCVQQVAVLHKNTFKQCMWISLVAHMSLSITVSSMGSRFGNWCLLVDVAEFWEKALLYWWPKASVYSDKIKHFACKIHVSISLNYTK